MVELTKAQHLFMRELYFKTEQEVTPKAYIWTKNTDYRTICALYKMGMITSTVLRNNQPTNVMLTQEGYDYGFTNFGKEEDHCDEELHQNSDEIFIKGSQQYKKECRLHLYRDC